MVTATREHRFTREETAYEMVRASKSFRYFLQHHVFLPQRTDENKFAGTIQWQWWPVHDDMIEDIEANPRLIVLKARQVSWSWFLAALHLWDAMFHPNYAGGMISAGLTEATELLGKSRFIWAHLPYSHLPALIKDNSEIIQFKASKGLIKAFPSTEKAGIGETLNRLTPDEAAFHFYAEQNYAAYAPAVEFGQLIIVSSLGDDKRQVVNRWFQDMWQDGATGRNDFVARFYPFDVRPGRDEEWYDKQSLRFASRPGQMMRQYPRNAEEAFRSMLNLRFNVEVMDAARKACIEPLRGVNLPPGLSTPFLKLWALPRPGIPYVAYTDGAEGKGKDYTVTVILEARTLNHVATLRENQLEPSVHAVFAEKLCRWYNTAFWGVERPMGGAIMYIIGQTQYPRGRTYWHQDRATSQEQLRAGTRPPHHLGFPVTEQTRREIIDQLAIEIETGALTSYDAEFWSEALTFIVADKGEGKTRVEAAPGRHDDYPMAMAGAVRMSKQQGTQQLQSQSTGPVNTGVLTAAWGRG